jgi:hypothetical protein
MDMTFDQWLKLGYDMGWAGPDVCETHDGTPISEAEDAEFEDGDPCIHVIRLYESPEHKAEIEANHSPSVWRATNKGW